MGMLLLGSPPPGSIHLNIGQPSAANGFSPFLDYFKTHQVSSMVVNRSAGGSLTGVNIWSAGGYLDPATGFLAVPCPADVTTVWYYFYTNSDTITYAANTGLVWNISWDGRGGTVAIELLTSGGSQSINNTTGTGTFTFGTNPGNTRIVVTVTDRNDPPRNIKVWQNRYNANWLAGEKFNPDWIAEARAFYKLRLVEWLGSNVTGTEMSTFTDYTQFADEGWFVWGAQNVDQASGPKGLVPLSLCAALANVTGIRLHFNIPYLATDACITSIATYMKANTAHEVSYEWGNEAWNSIYPIWSYCQTQGNSIWPADGARASKYYGYRSAQIMKIIKDVYNDTTRWKGVLGTQAVNPGATTNILTGIAKWKTDTASSLNVSDLFSGLYVTGYFGDTLSASTSVSAITKANPGVVTDGGTSGTAHGYHTGQVIRLYSTSMTELNGVDVTITVSDATHYSIGIDTSAYTTFTSGAGNYSVRAAPFLLMDQSNTNFIADPGQYPTKYTYFNQCLAESVSTGYSNGYFTSVCLATLKAEIGSGGSFTASVTTAGVMTVSAVSSGTLSVGTAITGGGLPFTYVIVSQTSGTPGGVGVYQINASGFTITDGSMTITSGYWESQKLLATANGLELNQYEGGCHYCGNVYLSNPGNAQFTEYLLASGHSTELAAVYADSYSSFTAVGGLHPSKYHMAGPASVFGTWGGMQTVPETPANPVWQAVGNANIA
jgi:hypothetical protein